MIQLEFINAKGLSMNAIYNEYMTITDCEGLHGVDVEMSSSTSPYFDGDQVDHMRVSPRNITLTYHLHTPIEQSLKYFNSIVKSKQKATLIETKEDGTKISIEGIVTLPPYTRLSDATAVQIQLYCSQPYWQDLNTIIEDIANVINLHYFPFDNEVALSNLDGGLAFPEDGVAFGEYDEEGAKVFYNNGDEAVGMVIEIMALQTIVNPRISKVSTDEDEYIGAEITLNSGEWVRINTNKGEKHIEDGNGELFNEVVYSGNDWLQLDPGYNELSISAKNEDGETITNGMYFTVRYKQKWQ